MGKPRLEARDLRSLERRSMYEIFRPLDESQPMLDRRRGRRGGRGWRLPGITAWLEPYDEGVDSRDIAALLWLPAVLLTLIMGIERNVDPLLTVLAIVLIFVGFVVYGSSGRH